MSFADVLEKIFSMPVSVGGDKVLGPNGFILAYLLGFVKSGVVGFFREFYETNFSEMSYFWGWFLKRVEHKTWKILDLSAWLGGCIKL